MEGKERKDFKFPKLTPAAVDYSYLKPPAVVNYHDVEGVEYFPEGGGITKFLVTEYTAGAVHHNGGIFLAEPGQGSSWHTHPEETEEEELMYIVEGEGTLYYKQNKTDYEIPLKKGDGIFTGHLTHRVKNTGKKPLRILFYLAPLPMTTIIYGGERDRGLGYVDYAHLKPPVVVHLEDTELTPTDLWRLIPPENLKHMSGLSVKLERVDMGTSWHTHTVETGCEDLFYIASGKGTMAYLHEGKVCTFPFKEGDLILSKHLTNYTWNTGTEEDVMIPVAGAPKGSVTMRHEGKLLPF